MSNLIKRNGIYHYDFTVKGVRKRGTTHQRDKYLAGLFVNDLIAKARSHGLQALLRETSVLKDFAPEFLEWVENSHSIEDGTRKYYRNGWRLLSVTAIAGKRMDEITNHLCETANFPGGPATANTALRTLRRMLAKAKETKKFFGDLPEIRMRKEESRERAMTLEEANSVADNMQEGDAKDAFLLLRFTGMRPKELFCMRWELVRFDVSLYANPGGKTKAARRWVPLLYDAMPILERRRASQGMPREGWVFPAESGSGHMETIHKAFTRARDASGLPKEVCLYTARHGHLTDLSKVLPLRDVMSIGGHSDTKTALRYQHTNMAEIQAKLGSGRVQ